MAFLSLSLHHPQKFEVDNLYQDGSTISLRVYENKDDVVSTATIFLTDDELIELEKHVLAYRFSKSEASVLKNKINSITVEKEEV